MSYIDRELLLIGVDGCISALHVQAKGDLVQEGAIKLVEATRDYIASLSTADDVVPVVRCRECKHYQHYGKTSLLENGKNVKAGWCYRRIRFDEECRMPADGFCSYGQRKEDGHEQ